MIFIITGIVLLIGLVAWFLYDNKREVIKNRTVIFKNTRL